MPFFIPDGGVSDIQHKQMATQAGDNVEVWAVKGNFDDCQTGVKNVFNDEKFNESLLDDKRYALSSAKFNQLGQAFTSGCLLYLQLWKTSKRRKA